MGQELDVREEADVSEFQPEKLIFTKHSIAGKYPALNSPVV